MCREWLISRTNGSSIDGFNDFNPSKGMSRGIHGALGDLSLGEASKQVRCCFSSSFSPTVHAQAMLEENIEGG